MTREPGDHLLGVLLRTGWPILRKYYRRHCCIGGTRTVIDAINEFGVEAKPLAVSITIFNPFIHDRVKRLGHDPDEAAMNEWIRKGGWILGSRTNASKPFEAGEWNGHLVVIFDVPPIEGGKGRLLLDMTIQQYDRPEKRVALMPAPLRVSEEFERGEKPLAFEICGCGVRYVADPENRTYEISPDWRSPSISARDEIVHACRAATHI